MIDTNCRRPGEAGSGIAVDEGPNLCRCRKGSVVHDIDAEDGGHLHDPHDDGDPVEATRVAPPGAGHASPEADATVWRDRHVSRIG